jgi:predicted phage-related endonuclease
MKIQSTNSWDWIEEDDVTVDRDKFIGGSDAGSVLNWNKYRSSLRLAMEKRGVIDGFSGSDQTDTASMDEKYIREVSIPYYFHQKEVEVETFDAPGTYISGVHPFMRLHLDGLMNHPLYGEVALEIKEPGPYAYYDWTGGKTPDNYYAQVLHVFAVTNIKHVFLFAKFGSIQEPRWFHREDCLSDINMLIEEECAFYLNHMRDKKIPAPSQEDDVKLMNELYPDRQADYIDISEYDEICKNYIDLGEEMKELKRKQAVVKATLKGFLGLASGGRSESYTINNGAKFIVKEK